MQKKKRITEMANKIAIGASVVIQLHKQLKLGPYSAEY